MASSPGASCLSDPNFAVICAFLERFAKSCGITYPAFTELQEMLENVEEVPQELIDLHIKLLRKARKTVFLEKWEKALIKFCHTYSNQDGWELERFGYKKTRLEVKLRVLKMLLEGQFDLNSKFKATVNTLESEELRSKPLGKDKHGRVYWLQFDPTFNIRVYREDMDEESWTLVAQDRASLVILLEQLCENEYVLDLNLLNGGNLQDLQEETLDTGQNNISTLENVNLIEQDENFSKISEVDGNMTDMAEKEKFNINDTLTQSSNVEYCSKTENNVTEDNHSDNTLCKSEINGDKPLSIEKPYENDDLGYVIEEPVMYITGEGSGEDCMTGNPEKEDKSEEESQKLISEKIEVQELEGTSHCSSKNIPSPRINLEKIKPAPKLWSIDTICGVNSSNETEEKISESLESFDVKLKQKNFSTFSIDSVLEKKDLISLSGSKTFSQFSVGSSNETFSEHIQFKESDYSENKSNSDINNSIQCNSGSSMITYKNSKVLPCVMISKTENLVDKSKDSKARMNEMDSSFIVSPSKDLILESVEQNINSQTQESSEVISYKCEQISDEREIFYESKTNINIDGSKTFSEQELQSSEKISEKELAGSENNDLKDSEIDKHDANKNNYSNKNVIVNEVLNVVKFQKNNEEIEERAGNDIDGGESIKNKPLLPLLVVEEETKSINITEEKVEETGKSKDELMPIDVENSWKQKQNILKCTINEPCHFENNLKKVDCLQSKTSDSEKCSGESEDLETKGVIETNYLKDCSDQFVLQNKTSQEEKVEGKKLREENIVNISFKCKYREGNETCIKNKLLVPKDNVEILSNIQINKRLLNLPDTHVFLENESNENLEGNEKSLFNVGKYEENKKGGDEMKKLSKMSKAGVSEKSETEEEKNLIESKSTVSETPVDKKLKESANKMSEVVESETIKYENRKLEESSVREIKAGESSKLETDEGKILEDFMSKKSNVGETKKPEIDENKKSGKDESKNSEPSEGKEVEECAIKKLEPDETKSEIDEGRKLEEEDDKGTSTHENKILSGSVKSDENVFAKIEIAFQKPKEENSSDDDLETNKIVEDKIKTSRILEEKKEKISNSLSKNKDEEKTLAGTNNVKDEKVESIFKSNENICISKIEEKPDQQEKKQSNSVSNDKKDSSENDEAKEIINDFDCKEKQEENQVIKSTDGEKEEEIKIEHFTISNEIREKLKEANNEKFEENLETDFNLIEGNEDTSKIKIINSISENVNTSLPECASGIDKIALNETSEFLEEEKLVESDTKATQVMSDSHELSPEEDETSGKKLSKDVPLNEHITEVNVIPELKSVEEKDMKLEETVNEEENNENTITEETSEKSTENITAVDETKEISQKPGRKRKKGSMPARIMSRNRKTADTTEEFDTTTCNTIKSDSDLKIDDEKLQTLSEVHSEAVEENVEQKDKEEERSENDGSIAEKKEVEVKKNEIAPVRRGRKPRGRKRRKNIAASGENKSATEEFVKDKPKFSEDDKEASSVKRKGRPKKDDDNIRTGGRQITSREIKLLGITNPDVELTSVRQSRRIAQMKMREEAERRRLEALQLESFKSKKKTPKAGKRKSRKNDDSDSYDEKDGANEGDSEDGKNKTSKEKKSRKKKKKDKLVFNELNPWLSSSGSSSADEEEEEIEEEPHDDEELVFKSDHEFSPESDVEDPDYKPMKRARTAKVEESKEEPGKYDDTSCEKCAKNDHPEWILLCDKCDKGWHASCVRPALMIVPEGDWFCPPCEHSSLIMKLQESLKQFDRCQRQREIEEMRKKRLAFVGISLDNVLPLSKKSSKALGEDDENEEKASNLESESGSEGESADTESGSDDSSEPVYQLRERRSNVTSYRYNEYDELIKSALQDEIEAVKGAGNAGRGKDINNIVNAEKQKQEKETQEGEEESESIRSKAVEGDHETQIDMCAKERVMKDDDEFEKSSDGNLVEEEEKDVVDEIPPVVPKDHSKKKKSKSLKITSLDFTSEEEDHNSDSDFKGASSEDESDYSLPSESESSDDRGKSKRSGPLRRSTRARTSRYDRDFINDESDDSPKRKKVKREWDSSESSDSDQSWGRKKRKGNRSTYKTIVRHSRKKRKNNKSKRKTIDSDNEEILTSPRPRNKKIKYGGLDSLDEQPVLSKRTRGKKINYQEMNGSDSEDEVKNQKARPSRVIDSDDDFIAENEKDEDGHEEEESEEIESEVDEDEEEDSGNEDFSVEKEKSRKNEKVKRKGIISDSDEYDKNDEGSNEDILSNRVKDPENANIKKEENIENNLDAGSASNQEKFFLEEEKLSQSIEKTEAASPTEKEMSENKLQNFPCNATSDFSGSTGKFPKIGKMKITPSRAEMASHSAGVPPFNFIVDMKKPDLTQDIGLRSSSENTFTSEEFVNQSSTIKSTNAVKPETNFLLRTLQSTQKPNSVDPNIPSSLPVSTSIIQSSRSPLSYPGNTPSGPPLNMIALLNSQNQGVPVVDSAPVGTPLLTTNSGLQFSTFKGVISQPSSVSCYPPSKIPTTVTGISEIESQNQSKKKASKSKKKPETFLPSPENGSDIPAIKDNVWPSQQTEEFRKMQGVQDSTPKKKGRGRGKKQLLAEAQAQALARTQDKQEPSQFLPQAIPGEGGSVISRILNTSQGSSSFPRCEPNQFIDTPRIRPFSPNLPPNFPSHRPMAHMRPRPSAVGGTIFHTSHPLDPSPSGGGAINISVANSGLTKPSPPISSPFTRGATLPIVPPRFPPDPNMRPLFTSRNSPRPEFSSFPHFYGNFPPHSSSLPNSENSNFSSSTFSESFGEDTQGSASNPKQFEDETGGEFGGLASYFASQREDDLET